MMIWPVLTALGNQWVGWGDWEPSESKGCSGEKMRDGALQALLPPSKVIKSPVLLVRDNSSRPGKFRAGARPGSGVVVQQPVKAAWGRCVCQLKGQGGGEQVLCCRLEQLWPHFLDTWGHCSHCRSQGYWAHRNDKRQMNGNVCQMLPVQTQGGTEQAGVPLHSNGIFADQQQNQSCSQGSGNWWMGIGWFGFFLSALWFPTKHLQWPKPRVNQALRGQVASRSPYLWSVTLASGSARLMFSHHIKFDLAFILFCETSKQQFQS